METQCAGTAPAINGTFTPNNPLSGFDGQARNGTWRLNIADRAGQDTGTVTSWCISGTVDGIVPPVNVFADGFEQP